jgi:hypothetical protein
MRWKVTRSALVKALRRAELAMRWADGRTEPVPEAVRVQLFGADGVPRVHPHRNRMLPTARADGPLIRIAGIRIPPAPARTPLG